jgi:hypothetical protein
MSDNITISSQCLFFDDYVYFYTTGADLHTISIIVSICAPLPVTGLLGNLIIIYSIMKANSVKLVGGLFCICSCVVKIVSSDIDKLTEPRLN